MKKYKLNLMILLFFIILFVAIFFISTSAFFEPMDEIWNFQNIFKMYHGGIIYQDNNVIDTPIFFILGNLIFHIFDANLLVFRIYGSCIYLLKYILMFLLLRKLGITNIFSILYVSLWLFFDTNNIASGANYNQLALVMCLLGFLGYATCYHKKFYHFMQGFIIFLVFFTKQNIGVYYALGLVLFELLETGFCKVFFVNQFKKLCSFLPCVLFSVLIMYFRGNLFDFINLCFGSLFEFGSKNRKFNPKTLSYIISMIFMASFSTFVLIKSNLQKQIKSHIKFLLCLAITLSFIMLPIINPYHTIMSLLFYYLLFIYTLDSIILREIFSKKMQKYIILPILIFILLATFLRTLFSYLDLHNDNDVKSFDKSHPFYNIPALQEDLDRIAEVTAYITEQKENGINVVCLSYDAASYMVPLQQNNGYLDMLLTGNLGYHGIENTIQKIVEMENTEFLIFTNEEDYFYQEPKAIRDFIINNFEKKGEFLNYSIYINK